MNQKLHILFIGVLIIAIARIEFSCGYHPMIGTVAKELGPVYVPPVVNETSFPGIGIDMTDLLREGLSAKGVDVVSESGRAAELNVRIVDVSNQTGAVELEEGKLAAADAVWNVEVEYSLRNPKGGFLIETRWKKAEGRNPVSSNVIASEALGGTTLDNLVKRLSDAIVEDILLSY